MWVDALNSSPACDTFSLARRRYRELLQSFGADPEFTVFHHAVRQWQTDWIACSEFHVAADAIIRGLDTRQRDDIRSLLRAIASARPVAAPLFRGFALPFHPWEILAEYPQGAFLDMALVSLTSDLNRALEFAWLAEDGEEGTQVVMYVAEGANAVRIDLLAPDEIHWREREWLSGGRFRITQSEYLSHESRVELHVTHESYYDAR